MKPTPDMDWLDAGEPIHGGPARGADGSIHVVSILCHGILPCSVLTRISSQRARASTVHMRWKLSADSPSAG